jgi:hypothetical protein
VSIGNGRNPAWGYDEDGRLLQDNDIGYIFYDAAGRNVHLAAEGSDVRQWYDGDGQVVKRQNTNTSVFPNTVKTTYYLHSSVMGGQVIVEINSQGQRQKRYVYAGTDVLATQEGTSVNWRHENPATGSRGGSTSSGQYYAEAEFDPTGVNVGLSAPPAPPPPNEPGLAPEMMPQLMGGEVSGRCTLDLVEFNCASAMRLMQAGSAVPCPNNDCRPRVLTDEDGNPHIAPLGFDPQTGQLGHGYWKNGGGDGGQGEPVYDQKLGIYMDVEKVNSTTHWVFETSASNLVFINMGFGFGFGGGSALTFGQDPVPQPAPTPAPPVGPCAWEEERDMNILAQSFGSVFNYKVNGGEWVWGFKPIPGNAVQQERRVSSGLAKLKFTVFFGLNSGMNYEGQINGNWYHVAVEKKNDKAKIEYHFELDRPSSWDHKMRSLDGTANKWVRPSQKECDRRRQQSN